MALWTQLIHQIHVSSVPSVRWDYICKRPALLLSYLFYLNVYQKDRSLHFPRWGVAIKVEHATPFRYESRTLSSNTSLPYAPHSFSSLTSCVTMIDGKGLNACGRREGHNPSFYHPLPSLQSLTLHSFSPFIHSDRS